MKPIEILELFGGIGALTKAFKRLGIPHHIADYVEIDKYAVASYNAINGTNFEPQDICKWDKDIEVDLIMHGSPCQDFSICGKGAGGDEGSGTRSSLMYETIRIVEKLKPKYVIWENVKNLLSKKHIHNFNAYLETMEQLGYINYYQVLNAKDYGIPQNRERVFTISIRKDINKVFTFPPKQELKLKLKDMLEEEVDEKYIISDKLMTYYERKIKQGWRKELHLDNKEVSSTVCNPARNNVNDTFVRCQQVGNLTGGKWDKINESCRRVYSENGLSPTIHTCQGGNTEPKVATTICLNSKGGRNGIEGLQPSRKDRIYDSNGIAATIATSDFYNPNYTDNLKIRKLTPCECWLLMSFDKSDFEKAAKVNSNTQLYKQAGNSIVVNVLEAILTNLLLEPPTTNPDVIEGQTTIFDYI